MKKRKRKLMKTLVVGTWLSACSACAIVAVALARHIETYYAPKFDADQLARDKARLALSIQVREIERNAIYEECYLRVTDTPYYKELERKSDSLDNILNSVKYSGVKEMYASKADVWTIMQIMDVNSKMIDAVENAVNETPRIRELDTKIAQYNKEMDKLMADSVKCVEWEQMSKMDRIRQNWKIMRRETNNDRLLARAYDNTRMY